LLPIARQSFDLERGWNNYRDHATLGSDGRIASMIGNVETCRAARIYREEKRQKKKEAKTSAQFAVSRCYL